jgi:hypothetical protein
MYSVRLGIPDLPYYSVLFTTWSSSAGRSALLIIDLWQVGCNVMHVAQTIHYCRGRCRRESIPDTPTDLEVGSCCFERICPQRDISFVYKKGTKYSVLGIRTQSRNFSYALRLREGRNTYGNNRTGYSNNTMPLKSHVDQRAINRDGLQ